MLYMCDSKYAVHVFVVLDCGTFEGSCVTRAEGINGGILSLFLVGG